jgi:hypothetical protein
MLAQVLFLNTCLVIGQKQEIGDVRVKIAIRKFD